MSALRAAQPPWSVNSLAQVAGVAALQPEVIAWREQTLAQLQGDAAVLWTDLSGLGMTILPTTTTFALAAVEDAALFRRWLLQDGLLVRDCASFGLPGYIRIAANRPEANRQLVRAIAVERQPVVAMAARRQAQVDQLDCNIHAMTILRFVQFMKGIFEIPGCIP